MSTEDLVKQFLANGGKIQVIDEGVTAIDNSLRNCRCGCNGNYTDHTMRAGESGRCSSIVIR